MTETTVKEVSEFGNGAHVTVPKEWLDDTVKLTRIPSGQPELFKTMLSADAETTFDIKWGDEDSAVLSNCAVEDAAIIDQPNSPRTALLFFEEQDIILLKEWDDDGWSETTTVLSKDADSSDAFNVPLAYRAIVQHRDAYNETARELKRELTELMTSLKRLEKQQERGGDNDADNDDVSSSIDELVDTRDTVENKLEEVTSAVEEAEAAIERIEAGEMTRESVRTASEHSESVLNEAAFATPVGTVNQVLQKSPLE